MGKPCKAIHLLEGKPESYALCKIYEPGLLSEVDWTFVNYNATAKYVTNKRYIYDIHDVKD